MSSFMQPEIVHDVFIRINLRDGSSFSLPADVLGGTPPGNLDGPEAAAWAEQVELHDYMPEGIDRQAVVESVRSAPTWAARWSAPGFLDCTDWTTGETAAEVAEDLAAADDDDETLESVAKELEIHDRAAASSFRADWGLPTEPEDHAGRAARWAERAAAAAAWAAAKVAAKAAASAAAISAAEAAKAAARAARGAAASAAAEAYKGANEQARFWRKAAARGARSARWAAARAARS